MRVSRFMFVAACFLSLSGCYPAIRYKPNPAVAAPPARKLRVAVAPFEAFGSAMSHYRDEMNESVELMFGPGYRYRYERYFHPSFSPDQVLAGHKGTTVALVKSGGHWTDVEGSLDEIGRKRYDECLADELRASGMFASVDYKGWAELVESAPYDLIVTGRFYYDRRELSAFSLGYPLSAFLQMIIPLPAGSAKREVALELMALDPKVPGAPLWRRFVESTEAGSLFLLNVQGHKQSAYRTSTPALLAKVYLEAREGLLKALEPGGALEQWAAAKGGN